MQLTSNTGDKNLHRDRCLRSCLLSTTFDIQQRQWIYYWQHQAGQRRNSLPLHLLTKPFHETLLCITANKELPLFLTVSCRTLVRTKSSPFSTFVLYIQFLQLQILQYYCCCFCCAEPSLNMRVSDVIKRRWALIPLMFSLTAFILSMLCIFA